MTVTITIKTIIVKAVTSQTAKNIGKEVGKTALEAGRSVAVDAGKKLIERAMRPKPSKKVENIVNQYMNGSAVAIQDLMKRLNGSGLKDMIKKIYTNKNDVGDINIYGKTSNRRKYARIRVSRIRASG